MDVFFARVFHRLFIYLVFAVMCLIPLGVTHLLFQWPLAWCLVTIGVLGLVLLTAFVSNLPTPPVALTQLAPSLAESILAFLLPIAAMTGVFLLVSKFWGRGLVANLSVIGVGALLALSLLRDTGPRFVHQLVRGRAQPDTIDAADLPISLPREDAGILWGGTLLPSETATNHFMVVGATGSGKTLTIRLLMQTALRPVGTGQNHRALLYDAKQDVLSLLAGMGLDRRCALYTLNPFDARCVCWDMQVDITEPATAFQAATLLIPEDKNSSQPFFVSAAQSLLYGVLLAYILRRKAYGAEWRFSDVVRAMQSAESLRLLLSHQAQTQAIAERFFGNLETLGNIMSTVATKMLVYEPIAALWDQAYEAGNRISLTDWLQSPEEREQTWKAQYAAWKEQTAAPGAPTPSFVADSRGTVHENPPAPPPPEPHKPASFENYLLVLGNNEKARRPLDAINRVLFQRTVELLLDQPEVSEADQQAGQERRTWIFLDEVAEAGRLDGLPSLLAKGRSKGACVVLGFQDIDGLKEVYGDNLTQALTGQCAHKAILRLESPATAEWASKLFGSYEALEYRYSVTHGSSSGPGGSSSSTSSTYAQEYVNRQSVLESEFFVLPVTSARNGLSGFYITPTYGAYFHRYDGADLFSAGGWERRRLSAAAPDVEAHRPRPEGQQWISSWGPDDYTRLDMPQKAAAAPPPARVRTDADRADHPAGDGGAPGGSPDAGRAGGEGERKSVGRRRRTPGAAAQSLHESEFRNDVKRPCCEGHT